MSNDISWERAARHRFSSAMERTSDRIPPWRQSAADVGKGIGPVDSSSASTLLRALLATVFIRLDTSTARSTDSSQARRTPWASWSAERATAAVLSPSPSSFAGIFNDASAAFILASTFRRAAAAVLSNSERFCLISCCTWGNVVCTSPLARVSADLEAFLSVSFCSMRESIFFIPPKICSFVGSSKDDLNPSTSPPIPMSGTDISIASFPTIFSALAALPASPSD
mmetsp:Transcript_34272/g.67377  ORF Transcript_34272/g.67377 Transcript_34272/m.67377 type:complete len:226 (+) Transcript_34272:2522-3199(+)